MVVGVVWGVYELTICGGDITGVGFGVGIGVGITLGSSMSLTWGLELGFGVGIFFDLLVGTASVGSGACGWNGSSQGAGAPVLASCSGTVGNGVPAGIITAGLISLKKLWLADGFASGTYDCTKGCCL